MERWTPKLKQEQCLPGFTLRMWTDKDGEYVLYTDHIAETRKLIDTYDLLIGWKKDWRLLNASLLKAQEQIKELEETIHNLRHPLSINPDEYVGDGVKEEVSDE